MTKWAACCAILIFWLPPHSSMLWLSSIHRQRMRHGPPSAPGSPFCGGNYRRLSRPNAVRLSLPRSKRIWLVWNSWRRSSSVPIKSPRSFRWSSNFRRSIKTFGSASAGPRSATSAGSRCFKRLALRDVNFRQPGNPELAPIVGISKLALKRWYALDLKTAREAILREISSPAPRFGADALGILPDQTLPAVQHIIAEHFVSLVAPGPTGVPPDSGLQARSSQSFPSLAATASTRAAGEPEAVRSRRPRSHQE